MKNGYDRQTDEIHSAYGKFSVKQNKYQQERKIPAKDFYYKSGNPFVGFLQCFVRKAPVKQVDDVNKLLSDIKDTSNISHKIFKCLPLISLFVIIFSVVAMVFRKSEFMWIFYCIGAVLFISFVFYIFKLYHRSKNCSYNISDYKRYIMNNAISTFALIDDSIYELTAGVPYNVIADTELFDKCDFIKNKNFYTGIHNGIYFAHIDISLTNNNEGSRTFFDGHMLSVKCPNDFNGIVTITDRQYKFWARKKNKNLTSIITNDSFVDSSFIVKTDNENLAKWLLVPEVIRLLKYLKQISNGSILVSFKDGYMHIFIDDKRTLFNIDTKNPDINRDVNNFHNSMEYICNIIDRLCN